MYCLHPRCTPSDGKFRSGSPQIGHLPPVIGLAAGPYAVTCDAFAATRTIPIRDLPIADTTSPVRIIPVSTPVGGWRSHCNPTTPFSKSRSAMNAASPSGARTGAPVGDTPHIDTNLAHGEIITAIDLPAKGFANHCEYLKVRDRTSYAFALVSVAAALELNGDTIADARLALGGVAHKPWRSREAEARLTGQPATRETFEAAAELALHGAKGFGANDFKIPLAKRAIVRALETATRRRNT